MNIFVKPARGIKAQLSFAGDKSLCHRLVLAPLLGPNKICLKNLSPSEDVATSLSAVTALGVKVTKEANETISLNSHNIFGNCAAGPFYTGPLGSPTAPLELYCGNSGTTARLLCGILSNLGGHFRLTGDKSLSKRPMGRVVEPLKEMGYNIYCENENTLPIIIKPTKSKNQIKGIDFFNEKSSAQVKSAIQLASYMAGVKSNIREPEKSRDHTEKLLAYLDKNSQESISFQIPGDISSAAYFGAMAAMHQDGSALLRGVLLNKTREGFFQKIEKMGAVVERREKGCEWEPWGDILVRGGSLKGIEVGAGEIAGMIDELPLLGVLMGFAAGKSVVRGAGELRHKECDRIGALVAGLRAIGVECSEREDGFEVLGRGSTKGVVEVESMGDHRMAMSFAVMGVGSHEGVLVRGAEAVGVSFLDFWAKLGEMGLV